MSRHLQHISFERRYVELSNGTAYNQYQVQPHLMMIELIGPDQPVLSGETRVISEEASHVFIVTATINFDILGQQKW
jgi:hypothetical protein